MFFALFIAYAVGFFLSFYTLFPTEWKGEPLAPDWTEFERINAKNSTEYYLWAVSSYIEAIDENAKVVARKAHLFELAVACVGVQVAIIFIMIVFFS